MAKPEWGTKRLCPSCGARFYDMKRNPVTCPSCDSDVSIEPLLKPKKTAVAKEAPVVAKVVEKPEVDESDELVDEVAAIADVEDDDDEDDLIVGVADLDEDEEDVSEIKEHIEEDINTDS